MGALSQGSVMPKLNVYIGWDEREQEAYDACVNSIYSNSGDNIECHPLKLHELQEKRFIFRERFFENETVSTGFAFTRFLVPLLNAYEGWAIFVDCDFIFTEDINNLFNLAEDRYSVMCVQHDYTPKQEIKMDGCKQTVFPRKNWSSLMLFNCSHHDCKFLTADSVSVQPPAWLHQMKWTTDDAIGELDKTWNWLVGEYDDEMASLNGPPSAIHYTNGGPWFEDYKNVPYAEEYYKYK